MYEVNESMLLVGREYHCKRPGKIAHKWMSTEDDVTRQLPEGINVAFRLSHCAARTMALENFVVERLVMLHWSII